MNYPTYQKSTSCIQAATILLFVEGYQLHLTCRKYDTC